MKNCNCKKYWFNYGRASKWNGDKCIRPVLGYNWFLFLPHFNSNGGWQKNQCLDLGISWLCFWVGVTIYPTHKAHEEHAVNSISKIN